MKNSNSKALSKLPQVESVLKQERLITLVEKGASRKVLTSLVQEVLAQTRQKLKSGAEDQTISPLEAAQMVEKKWQELLRHSMQRVINGTGIILNTNLGRSPIAKSIAEHLENLLTGYSNLEYEIENGGRSHRTKNISRLLGLLTGAQAAIAVNNNAAAVMLAFCALAEGKEVIVSRSELIEIGGNFRLPDVISSCGAKLVEVGTTNKTRLQDYADAVNENTACLLKCHQSNFKIIGFTNEVDAKELSKLAAEKNVPFVHDLGSGAFVNIEELGLEHEPTVQESIEQGADLVLFSADKMLGGSQAGIIAGRSDLVKKLSAHPIYRTLRMDKLNIALLESVLACYLKNDAWQTIPALSMAKQSDQSIKQRAESFLQSVSKDITAEFQAQVVSTASAFGGGSLPGQSIPSFGIAFTGGGAMSASALAKKLRLSRTPVICLVQKEKVIIDFRTVMEEDEPELLSALNNILDNPSGYNEQDKQDN